MDLLDHLHLEVSTYSLDTILNNQSDHHDEEDLIFLIRIYQQFLLSSFLQNQI